MSGECYPAKNMHMELNSSRKDKALEPTINTSKLASTRKEVLSPHHIYEAQDVSLEIKNNEIKQSERMKQIYHDQNLSSEAKLGKRPKLQSAVELFGNVTNTSKPVKKMRQNSQAIGTDTTGAPLGTINNILAGITKPVHMADFFFQKNKTGATIIASKTAINYQEQLHGVEEIKINSRSKQLISVKSKTKFRAKRSRSKVATIASASNFKKVKKAAIKVLPDKGYHRGSDIHLNKVVAPLVYNRSKRFLVRPNSNPNNPVGIRNISTARSQQVGQNQDLVEIYHNNAVRETKSSESDMTKKKVEKLDGVRIRTNLELVPALTIGDNDVRPEVRGTVSCIYKNYTMPTIASRMKQAAKYYMNSFNIKTIPFCLSTSTSPSHNIGINIQQVMSMVKSKQPVTRLSPTLAYNIGLAAGKNEDTLLPLLVSTVNSKTFYSQCPLTKPLPNYQTLQEMAKNVPQDTIEEIEENEEQNSPETQSVIITGPSGDVKIRNKKQTVWTASSDEKKCTCVPSKGIAFQQIINKFNSTGSKHKSFNNLSGVPPKKMTKKLIDLQGGGEETNKPSAEMIPLQNKEKKLKEVLRKLHDEFEKMTNTYDDLVKKSERGSSDEDTSKALEALDKELNSKEEEIVMVMSLYKEVLALKQQVKTLKERASKENIFFKTQSSRTNGINNNSTTAGLLNQLLQRVQHFQTHYKKT